MKKRIVLGGAFFVLLVMGTGFVFLRWQDRESLISALASAELLWLLAAVLAMLLYFALDALNIARAFRLFGSPAPYRHCILYSLTGFFFSGITPSSSGGQPMQLYAMHRNGQEALTGTLVLLTVFLSFQTASLSWGLLGFFLCRSDIRESPLSVLFWVSTGLSLALMAILLFCPRLLPEKTRENVKQCGRAAVRQKGTILKLFLTSLVQLAALHSIPFWVFQSFGQLDTGFFSTLALQAFLYVSISSLPLPGGVGVSEGGFLLLYPLPPSLLPCAMVLSRFFGFYLWIPLSGLLCFLLLFPPRKSKQKEL